MPSIVGLIRADAGEGLSGSSVALFADKRSGGAQPQFDRCARVSGARHLYQRLAVNAGGGHGRQRGNGFIRGGLAAADPQDAYQGKDQYSPLSGR